MTTKNQQDNASPMRKGGQSQQNKTGKLPSSSSVANNNSCTTDMEQQNSSNKGKGPAGENL